MHANTVTAAPLLCIVQADIYMPTKENMQCHNGLHTRGNTNARIACQDDRVPLTELTALHCTAVY